ncbi:2488_t:CDS:2, partial [Ambispora leptoticha]
MSYKDNSKYEKDDIDLKEVVTDHASSIKTDDSSSTTSHSTNGVDSRCFSIFNFLSRNKKEERKKINNSSEKDISILNKNTSFGILKPEISQNGESIITAKEDNKN